MSVSYFIYNFYQDDYLPEQVRDHHESNGDSSLKSFSNNTTKKKFVPRKQYHEDNEYKRSDDEIVTLNNLPGGELASLRKDIQELEAFNAECEKKYNEFMPPNQIIDPINSQYFQDIDRLILDLQRGLNLYTASEARARALEFSDQAETTLGALEEVSSRDFATILRAPLVCRQTNLSVLLESVIELAEEDRLSNEQKEQIASFMAVEIAKSLEIDNLQDNILMNLTLLKGVGLLAGVEDGFYKELEQIFDELRGHYTSVYEEPDVDTIVNPGQVYSDYRFHQSRSSQRAQDLIYSYLDKYFE